jgi:hypothetical protein
MSEERARSSKDLKGWCNQVKENHVLRKERTERLLNFRDKKFDELTLEQKDQLLKEVAILAGLIHS